MIIKEKDSKVVPISELFTGDAFLYNGVISILLNRTSFTAVELTEGFTRYYPTEDMKVKPVRIEMEINWKLVR